MIPDYEQHLSDYIASLNRQLTAVEEEEGRLRRWLRDKQQEATWLSGLRDEAEIHLQSLREERGRE